MKYPSLPVPDGLLSPNKEEIEKRLKDIFSRGNVAKFTYPTGAIKLVKEWNVDSEGDLKAFESSGMSPYVCWEGNTLKISELETTCSCGEPGVLHIPPVAPKSEALNMAYYACSDCFHRTWAGEN